MARTNATTTSGAADSALATGDRGIAMIATLLVMMLVSALLVGFTAVVMSDQRFRGIDRARTQAFYAAHAGLEKLTTDLGKLFLSNFAPSAATVNALESNAPQLPGITFVAAGNTPGYLVDFTPDPNGNPLASMQHVASGPYQGLIALLTPYTIHVTAKTDSGGEVHLTRTLQTVAIPVFQFGMFSAVDLSFFAGPNFNFGGRVHTNGNLFLSSGATLTLSDKVTAVGEVIRENLPNGASIDTPSTHLGNVSMATATGAFRDLLRTEGSLEFTIGSALNDPIWTNVSISDYNGYLRNGRTGAKPLNLPLLTVGGTNTDLVRRPAVGENVANPTLFGERDFGKVSLRILLSDTQADILTLPTVTQTPPVLLDGNWNAGPPAGYVVDNQRPPIATSAGLGPGNQIITTTTILPTAAGANAMTVLSTANFPVPGTYSVNGVTVACTGTAAIPTQFTGCSGVPTTVAPVTVSSDYTTPAGTGVIGGFLKIERQDANGGWWDVTTEILNLGIASSNLANAACGDPNPNAIIRLQRLRNNPGGCDNNTAANTTSQISTDYVPQTLFDTREGLVRDAAAGGILLGGVMHYVMIDARNLSRWFQGQIGVTGANARSINGFSVYFSDRRNNRNLVNQETGEYGSEDIINPLTLNGAANGVLDQGEDVNANALLDTYGQIPANVPANSQAPLDATARPWTQLARPQIAQNNRAILFRRGLKLVNGSLGNLVAPGLTIVSENPVYIHGDWNASAAAGFGDPHVATSVIADAVTLLSNDWNDNLSFTSPYTPGGRPRAAQTFYRVAIIAGKNPTFQQPAGWGAATDFGTDGGAHNFLRSLEGGGQTVNYQGSIATFYYSRQALGTYKCCATVYGPPVRNYTFDIDFLNPTLLPPLTPVFRDVNTLGFSQETRPGK